MSNKPLLAESLAELQEFLAATIAKSSFELVKVNLSQQDEWVYESGAISHRSGEFFHVTGVYNRHLQQERLMLFQPNGALTGLAISRAHGTVCVLLQARVEPGNTGIGQYGPTIQSTPGNYQRVHGGKATSYLGLFNTFAPNVRQIARSMQLDLGERYFQKSKSHVFIEAGLIETLENMIWVPLQLLSQALAADNFLNADLRSLLGVFDWEQFLFHDRLAGVKRGDEGFLTALLDGSHSSQEGWEFRPLSAMDNWQLADEGMVDCSGSGISVGIYRVACTNREATRWVQPLMSSNTCGNVILLMREKENNLEFLVTLRDEAGISGGLTVLPSLVVYPGSVGKKSSQWTGAVVVAQFMQSDEGGRFYRHESLYQLMKISADIAIDEKQYWISANTLKHMLKTSNSVSFQLRCLSSLILDRLNPRAFQRSANGISGYNLAYHQDRK